MSSDAGDGASRLANDLSPEDFLRVADARRDIWTAGFRGLAAGALAGGGLFYTMRFLKVPFALTKNAAPACVFAGFAFGGFLASQYQARRSFSLINDVFETNAKPRLTPYEERRQRLAEEARPAAVAAPRPPAAARNADHLPDHLKDFFPEKKKAA